MTYRKSLLILVTLLFWAGTSWGAGGTVLWEDRFDSGNGFNFVSALGVKGNRLFSAGFGETCDDPPTCSMRRTEWVVRALHTKTGAVLWQDRFDRGGGFSRAQAVAVTSERVFAAGSGVGCDDPPACTTGSGDWVVRAYDAKTGTLLWNDEFGVAGSFDEAFAVVVAGGRVFVAGDARSCENPPECSQFPRLWVVRAYDPKTGTLLWQDQFDNGAGLNRVRTLAVKGQRLFAGGDARACSDLLGCTMDPQQWVVRTYDTKTGALLWQDRFDNGGGNNGVNAITVKDRWVFASGGARAPCDDPPGSQDCLGSGFEWVVRAYDAKTGTLLWSDVSGLGGTFSVANGIVAGGKRVFAAGFAENCPDFPACGLAPADWLVRAYDRKTGALLWQDRFNRGGASSRAIAITLKGKRVFAVGSGECDSPGCSERRTDWVVRAYETATGGLLWDDQFDAGEGRNSADTVAVKGKRLFVGGNALTCKNSPECTKTATEAVLRTYRTK